MESEMSKERRRVILWMIIGAVMAGAAFLSYPDLDWVDILVICAVAVLEVTSIYQLNKFKKEKE